MRVVIAGGSGFLGRALRQRLAAGRHQVNVLTRRPHASGDVQWDPARPDAPWAKTIDGADAVVNLAGESIAGGRWTAARKAALRDSRMVATRAIVAAIDAAAQKPAVLINGSAMGYYGDRGDETLTEDSPPGTGFLAELVVEWEAAARGAERLTRLVLLRTGLALDKDEGALPQMARPFFFMAGGPVGSGRQWLSWIHVDDWVEMTLWALLNPGISGPLNATAPNPVTNREFANALGAVLGRPAFMPAPAPALRLVLGEMAEMILTGQRILPAKAQELGFRFRYAEIETALRAIYGAA